MNPITLTVIAVALAFVVAPMLILFFAWKKRVDHDLDWMNRGLEKRAFDWQVESIQTSQSRYNREFDALLIHLGIDIEEEEAKLVVVKRGERRE